MDTNPYTIFSKEALEKADGKIVPLVTYTDGIRRVIGEATLHTTKSGLSVSASTTDEEINRLLREGRKK